VSAVRVFAGRTSTGVRGIRLVENDQIVTLTILSHVEATAEERDAYLRQSGAVRRGDTEETDARFDELAATEDFLLTVSENGYGARTSAYEYRLTNRGGSGIWNMDTGVRNGNVLATFKIASGQHVMLVTDRGQIIRMDADDVRITGRRTMGVRLFRLAMDERVVSITRLDEDALNDDNEDDTLEEAQVPEEGNEEE
ncbi:MAG: DNA gyrase C-terminal beta-propeller domain-containing protein, partial [Pseudomonadota bacterium]|nr:DNA gyrase C-terminal beta-propeller domain-containing protein [Pseudomonadota bacterium]